MIYYFKKVLLEEVVAESEEEARRALTWPNDEWELIDVKDPQ